MPRVNVMAFPAAGHIALVAIDSGICEHDAGFADVAQTLSGIALEATRKQPPDRRRHVRRQPIERDVVFDHGGDDLGCGFAAKQLPARQHLEQHDAERPDVRAFVDRASLGLLGRHVRRGAEDQTPFGPRGRQHCRRIRVGRRGESLRRESFGEAEVEDFYRAVRR